MQNVQVSAGVFVYEGSYLAHRGTNVSLWVNHYAVFNRKPTLGNFLNTVVYVLSHCRTV